MKNKCFLAIAVSALITSLLFIGLQRPTFHVLKSWEQSVAIDYSSFDSYFLHIVEDNIDLGHIPFTAQRNYFIYVGKDENEVIYGHAKNYSFEYNHDIQAYLDDCKVDWSQKGVTFKEPSGHSIFIPKEAFIGGR